MAEVYKHEKHKIRWPGRAYLLYLLAMPLVPALLIVLALGDLPKLLIYGGAFASFVAAARFMRKGLVAEAEFRKRKIAKASKTPLKTLGSIFTGIGTFITQLAGRWPLPAVCCRHRGTGIHWQHAVLRSRSGRQQVQQPRRSRLLDRRNHRDTERGREQDLWHRVGPTRHPQFGIIPAPQTDRRSRQKHTRRHRGRSRRHTPRT